MDAVRNTTGTLGRLGLWLPAGHVWLCFGVAFAASVAGLEAQSSNGQERTSVSAAAQLLEVGKSVEGVIETSSAVVFETERNKLRGVEFRLKVPKSGTYTIELRSYEFDAALILQQGGKRKGVDNDGISPNMTHARLVSNLTAGIEYVVQAVSLTGANGDFVLEVQSGRPARLSRSDRALHELDREIAWLKRKARTESGLSARPAAPGG